MLELGNGATIIVPGSIEVRLTGRLRLRRLSPADTYGGWLAFPPVDQAQADAVVTYMRTRPESIRWLINPFLACELVRPGSPSTETHTLAIDLTQGYDRLRGLWSKGHRAAPAQARRNGLSVRLAVTEQDWSEYFAAYLDSIRRWGPSVTSRYDWAVFLTLSHIDPAMVRLWLAEKDGQIVSGALFFYHPNQIVLWHAATLESFFPLRPANLLIDEAIRHACSLEAHWLDLGPSGGHQGVERFKLGFGPVRLGVPVIDRSTPAVGLIRGVRSALRRGWRRTEA